MSIVTAVVLATILLVVSGCATSSPPSSAKQEMGKKESATKVFKHDERRSMNEESENAIR